MAMFRLLGLGYELLHFGFVAQWLPFCEAVLSRHIYMVRGTSLHSRELFFRPRRFTSIGS
jgi:hypothetical protein